MARTVKPPHALTLLILFVFPFFFGGLRSCGDEGTGPPRNGEPLTQSAKYARVRWQLTYAFTQTATAQLHTHTLSHVAADSLARARSLSLSLRPL